MLRFKSNCKVMLVVPRKLDEVISLTPAILPNCRSSGVATEDAMISGLAPGRLAPTEIVGKSICGSADTGKKRKATAPARATAAVNRVVATGRCMNGEEGLIGLIRRHALCAALRSTSRKEALCEAIEENVDHRSGVQRQNLAKQQTAHHRDAQRAPKFSTAPGPQGERQSAE